jgi:hypothetical protein
MMIHILTNLAEAMTRPGLMSVVGVRREKICTRDLKRYFRLLGERVEAAELGKLATVDHKDAALSAANLKLAQITRALQPMLLQVLSTNLYAAILEGDKLTILKESVGAVPPAALPPLPPNPPEATVTPTGLLGLSGQEAAAWASLYSSELVTGIDQTTRNLLRDAIETGIEDKLGVDGLAKLIREVIDGMTTRRSELIASTEMNAAFSEAALRKMRRLNTTYKRLILAPGACPICSAAEAKGPIPIDEPFTDDGDQRTPLHPYCRCATVGARAPETEN